MGWAARDQVRLPLGLGTQRWPPSKEPMSYTGDWHSSRRAFLRALTWLPCFRRKHVAPWAGVKHPNFLLAFWAFFFGKDKKQANRVSQHPPRPGRRKCFGFHGDLGFRVPVTVSVFIYLNCYLKTRNLATYCVADLADNAFFKSSFPALG